MKGATMPELIKDESLATLFRESARLYSSKTALIFGNRQLSYSELDSWSDQVAGYIRSRGIGRGAAVGVWQSRGLALHAVILGILKAGAAYVPLDREMPEERVQVVMEEVGAAACFSDGQPSLPCPVLSIPEINTFDPPVFEPGVPGPEDNAYVLYTSGSTGKPKGIPIRHKHICHLVRAEASVIGVKDTDRVYQGFSVSFDMWCEETWISFFAGATLWVADAVTAKSIDQLSDVLREQQITILHAVPSLLAVMDDDIPALRVINAGGEACTASVLNRWSKPGKNVFYNSYGPTETTVTATMAALKPGDVISIGLPLPNYNLAVIDEEYNTVPMGTQGQLIISGPGVCSGYVNRPDLTQEKFLAKPASLDALPGDTIYLSGDAVVMHPDGNIDFHGRLDDQVKLRGYRIELGEIEVRLNALANVSSAAVALKKDANAQDQLVGYVVLKQEQQGWDAHQARLDLAEFLPNYMVPLVIVSMPEMPRLPSGKIDRKSLPVPEALLSVPQWEERKVSKDDPVATKVMAGLEHVFPGREISEEADFFTDLGGHSLLAATFSSWLRKEAGMPQASLKDIYTHRPVGALIRAWEAAETKAPAEKSIFHKIPPLRYFLCGLAQALSLLLIYGLFAVQIFVPYLGYYYVVARTESGTADKHIAIITALVLFCLIPPLFSMMGIAAKWLLIGRAREGDYPLWGGFYFRYWLVNSILRLVPIQFMNGTPLYPFYLRLLGVKIAPDAQISAVNIGAHDLLEIGADASVSSQVVLNNAWVEDGLLKLRRIRIADHAYVGSNAVVGGGCSIETWAELLDQSHLQGGRAIPAYEIWKGSPAEKVTEKEPSSVVQPLNVTFLRRKTYALLFTLLLTIFPVFVLLPLLPVIMALNYLDLNSPDYNFNYFIHVPLLTLFYLAIYMTETVLLSRLLLWRIKPGTYPIFGGVYIRKWLSSQLISVSLIVLHPVYATIYVSIFFRLLGARIGKNTEISTASNVTHTMLNIGEGSFIADAVNLGEEDIRGQRLILERTSVGNNTFVGNSALVPQGYALGDNMLIGVLSVPPTAEQQRAAPGAGDWFGSPAISLPRRQSSGDYPDALTKTPSVARRIARGTVELIRIVLPETIVICCSVLFIAYCHDLVKDRNMYQVAAQLPKLPFYYLFYMGLPAFFITVALKWITVGRYKEEQKPMWTHKVWRSEAITTTYEALAVPFFLEYLKGTPFLPLALWLLGVKTGKRVYLNTTDFTEYDMVSIGDDTALNDDSGAQTHLFEDRVMKVGYVVIGARCSIGARSIVLYDTEIEDDVRLESLSLVMKGEKLTAGTRWAGSPVKAM